MVASNLVCNLMFSFASTTHKNQLPKSIREFQAPNHRKTKTKENTQNHQSNPIFGHQNQNQKRTQQILRKHHSVLH